MAAATAALVALLVLPAGASPTYAYVAMGDSYSAASGNLPLSPTAPADCTQSTVNYPHLIAASIGASLTDVTCGGAQTKDYFGQQFPDTPPQLNALSSTTRLVTMTIGGNDSGVFIDAITECGSLGLLSLGQGRPCKNQYGDSFVNTINNVTYPSLVKALTAVRQKAPNARVAILSYPEILPPTGGCYPQMPVASGDVPYLYGIESALNSAVQRAADVTGVSFVDLTPASTGHDACKPIGVRWIEPALLGTNPVIVHPNAFGEQQMALNTIAKLNLG